MNFDFNPSLWFVCRLCQGTFPSIDKLKEHKLGEHYEDCSRIKCIIFEERFLEHEWIPDKDSNSYNLYSNQQLSSSNLNSNYESPLHERILKDSQLTPDLTNSFLVPHATSSPFQYELMRLPKQEPLSPSECQGSSILENQNHPPGENSPGYFKVEIACDEDQDQDQDPFETLNDDQTHEEQNLVLPQRILHGFTIRNILDDQEQEQEREQQSILPSEQKPVLPVITNNSDNPNSTLSVKENSDSLQSRKVQAAKCGKPFMCPTCFAFFKTNCDLRKHTRSHSTDRPFKCPHCPGAFKSKSAMQSHLIIHGRVTSLRCRFCNKFFEGKKEHENHERTHTGERPFKCEVTKCQSAFHSKSALTTHIRSKHSEELGLEQFICPSCGKSYGHQYILNNHIRIHHSQDKTFKCTMRGCTRAFKIKKYLLRHLKGHVELEGPDHDQGHGYGNTSHSGDSTG